MKYFDNAATSFYKPEGVVAAITDYLKAPGNPDRGVNEASVRAGMIVFDVRTKIAGFFGLKDFRKCVFTSGITESLNTVIGGLIDSSDHVVTTYLEHNSALRPLYRTGCALSITDGSLMEIKKAIRKNTKAIVVNHASNVTGEILELSEIGKLCRENGILLIVDSAQSAGIVPIDMTNDNIDILLWTAHRGLRGIQGLGGIIVNCDSDIRPLKVGGSGVKSFDKVHPSEYPTKLEAGTLNIPGIAAIGASLDYVKSRISHIRSHEMGLLSRLLDYLRNRNDVTVYRNDSRQSCGLVSFNIAGKDAASVSDYMSVKFGICVRSGAMCAPLVMEHYGIPSCVRVSFGLNNTQEDTDVLIEALEARRPF